MNLASRFMPRKVPQPLSLTAWALLIAFGSWLAYVAWRYPIATGTCIAAFAAVYWLHRRSIRNHLRALAADRSGESMCTFSRAVDCRTLDPCIVRAVYEAIEAYLAPEYPGFPVRWDDRLQEDLRIDPDELDELLAIDIAERTGRDLRNTETNPLFGKVETVRDLVMFFHQQPAKDPSLYGRRRAKTHANGHEQSGTRPG